MLATDTLVERLKADLRSAMKARESSTVMTLRAMLSALDNATAVEVDASFVPLYGRTPDVPRRELSEAQQLEILRTEAESRRSTMRQFEQLGKVEDAARMRAELEVFARYLDDGAFSS
jgi:uncharacterized protein YqeY